MNESHKELLRQVQELLQASERRMTAGYGRFDRTIDSCLTMGGTASSSSTSAGCDVCCIAEVPTPASFSPNASLVVTIDDEDLATPTPARCSMEGSSRDITELRSTSAPATAPTTPTATVDTIPVLAAPAASDGTLDGEAISGDAGTPATCSVIRLPRHPVAAPVLVASSPPTPTKPSSSQHGVPVHRPMPWPSFMGFHADGDETRPLPWPSFWVIDGCESPSDAVMKPSRLCSFGNLFTSTGCIIINNMCISSELRCLDKVLLSTSNYVQLVHATFVWSPCSITRFKWVIIRSIKLKLFSHGLEQSLILDSIGRSDSSYDHFSCVFRDASHWHKYFVTGVHMHVSVICSVWRLLIGSVTSVHFLNLAKFLVRPRKQHGELLYVSGLYLTKFSGMFRESLQGCDTFQWTNACYAALAEACFPCSVPDHISKWLMLWSTTESKPLVSCYLTSHGHYEVVKWYIESAALLVYRVHTDPNLPSTSFRMLRASYDQFPSALLDASIGSGSCVTDIFIQDSETCFRYMILVQLAFAAHFAVYRNCPADCQFDLRTHTTWYSYSKYCMMVVSNSAFIQHATAWDSGQQVSYDQLFGAFQNASYWPGNFVTSDRMQVNDACLTWQLFLSSSSISLLLVKKILVRAKEPYDTKLYVSQLAGAKSVYHSCHLQCDEAIFGYPVYCPSFSSACEGSVWEGKKLELNNWVSYTAQYIDQCSIGIKTGPHFSGKSASRALMQGMSLSNEGSYMFDALVLSYMGFPAVCALIQARCTPSSKCDESYSRKVELYMAARELLLFQHQVGDNGVAIKQSGNLVLRTDVPWNPGGSIWHVRATRSVRRLLLIGPVTSVPFRNLVKLLVRPKKQHGELLYVLGIYLAKLSGMVREFQNWLIYMLQHPDSRRPESAMTRAIFHVSASEPIPITFHVFAMSLELALNHATIGQRVLLILSHSNALRYWVLWSFTTAVPTEIVNMFNTHPSATVMIEIVSAVAANHSWDVPLFFSMYPSISFCTVQILFSAYMSDNLVSVAPVAIRWFPSAPCKFRSHKCMHGINTNERRVESLGGPTCVLYSRTSFLLLVHLIMVKSKQQVAVYSNCPAYRQLGLGTNTTGYSDCKDSMMVVNNSAISIHVKELQGAYVSAQLQWGNIVSVLTCGLIDLGKFCPNWKFVHSAIGRPAWLIPIQSVALKNMELWWFTTALLTEIASMFSTGLSMQLACSVQSTLLFTYAYQLECSTIATHWNLHEPVCCYQVSSCLPVAQLGLMESPCYLLSGWMYEAYWKQLLPHSSSPSDANVVRVNFWRKTHPDGILMQGGTHADYSGLASCRLWQQNHQVTMQIQIVWSTHIQTVCTSFLCMIIQRTSQVLLLTLCLNMFAVQLLQTWPPPIAYCSITSNMFSYHDLAIPAICEVWLLNYLDTKQMLIEWPPRIHAGFITYKLPTEENLSCCFLSWYYGGLALFLAFDRQEVFQGGRHGPGPDQHMVLRLQWDPGGAAPAWGQAEFQGGRGVRGPSHTSTWSGTWAVVVGLGTHQRPATRGQDYKYARHSNGNGIQTDHGKEPALSRPPCFSVPIPCFCFSSPSS